MMWLCKNCGWTGDKNFLILKEVPSPDGFANVLCCPSCFSHDVEEVEAAGLKWMGRQILDPKEK